MPFSLINKDNQKLFLGSGQVFGAQSIEGGYELNETPLKFIGSRSFIKLPAGVQMGTISMTALVANKDPFIKCISEETFNGFVLKDTNNIDDNYSFYSGYLTNYTSSCSVGEMPQVAASFSVLGDLGKIPTGEFPAPALTELRHIRDHPNQGSITKISTPSNVEITLDDFTTNLVNSYQISIDIGRQDHYIMGNRFPHTILINYPILVNVSFEIIANDYSLSSFRGFPCKSNLKNFDIKIKEDKTDSIITSFAFSGMQLVSESYAVNTENNLIIRALYRSYLPNLTTSGGNVITAHLTTSTP